MLTLSRLIRLSRLIQPPEEQNAPVLSVSNERATFGGWPLRMPATILLLSIEPTLLIVTFGWSFLNPARARFQMPSSRPVKPLHTVSVTGFLVSNLTAAAVLLVLLPPPLPPPHPAINAPTTTSPITNPIRRIPAPLSQVAIWLRVLPRTDANRRRH